MWSCCRDRTRGVSITEKAEGTRERELNMEIELKYLIGENTEIDRIFNDDFIQSIRDDKDEEMIRMHAVYYDTEDDALAEHCIALRIRRENDYYIGTLKWDGTSENGMHRRQEVNIPLNEEDVPAVPKADIFQPCGEIYDDICRILKGRKLVPRVEMTFVRRQIRLDTGKSICVLSADQGEIRGGDREIPVRELEIELLTGSEKEIMAIGDRLSAGYDLKPEDRSKLERGFRLIR